MRFNSLLILLAVAAPVFAGVAFEPDGGVFLTRGGSRAIVARDHVEWPALGIGMRFSSVAASSHAEPLDPIPGRVDYLIGNDPAKWRLDVHRFGRVRYRAIVRKTDLEYHGAGNNLEFDFILAPGAEPNLLALDFDGASLRLDHGALIATGAHGGVRLHRPSAWQEIGGKRVPVNARFRMNAGGRARFEVAAYDHARPLIIDPVVQVATYYGGATGNETNIQMTTDPAGNVYLAGSTDSSDLPYATYPGSPYNRPVQLLRPICFLTRMHPDGAALDYSIYFGGSGGDSVLSLVRDNLGFIHVLGATGSPNFPVASTAWRSSILPNVADTFWAKFDPQTGKLVASTFLGVPSQSDVINPKLSLAVDSVGEAFIGGNGTPGFTATTGAYSTNVSSFVLRLNAAGTGITYATGLPIALNAMQVDAAGGVVFGGTNQIGPGVSPPIVNPLPGTGAPSYGYYGYIARLNPAGSALTFGSYLGTGITSITADPLGNMHILGTAMTLGVPATNPVHLGPAGTAVMNGSFWVELQASTFSVLAATTFNDGSPAPVQFTFLPNGSTCMFVTGPTFQQAPGGLLLTTGTGGITCLDQTGAQYFTTGIPPGLALMYLYFEVPALALAPAPDGGIWIAGQTGGLMQTTPGVIQPNFAGGYSIDNGTDLSGPNVGTDAAVMKLSPLNPTPYLANVAPSDASLGAASMTFYINGAGFAYGTQLLWNGNPVAATIASSSQISVYISDPNLLQPGTVELTASLPAPGGGVSNAVNLELLNPAPAQFNLSPNQISAGSSAVGLLISGGNLLPSSTVTWDGQPRSVKYATAYNQPTLQITLSAADLAAAGLHNVVVTNPAPGGGSGSATFTVTGAATPLTLSATVPVNILEVSGSYPIGLRCTGLTAAASATWDGTAVASTVNATGIVLTVPPQLVDGQSRHVASVTQGGQTVSSVVYVAVPWNRNSLPAIDFAGQKIYYLNGPSYPQNGPTSLVTTDFELRTLNTVTISANPTVLSLSSDGAFLYLLDTGGTVYRYNTATAGVDLQFTPDPAFYGVASALTTLPGQPDSIATTTTTGIVIFDHGVPRPNAVQTNAMGNIFTATADRVYFPPLLGGCLEWIGYDEFGFASAPATSCDPAMTGLKQDSLLTYLSTGASLVPVSFGNVGGLIFPDLPDRHVMIANLAGIVDWNLDSLSSTMALAVQFYSAVQLDNTHLLMLGSVSGFVFDRTNP